MQILTGSLSIVHILFQHVLSDHSYRIVIRFPPHCTVNMANKGTNKSKWTHVTR